MTETEIQQKELKYLIEDSVDESVERAFKKYAKQHSGPRVVVPNLLLVLVLAAAVVLGVRWYQKSHTPEPVAPVEDHDLTLENDGIFGFTVADFQTAVLGESSKQRFLIVEEQEAYVNTTITETGFLNWGVFTKQQPLTIHGVGEYTINMAEIHTTDISLNEDTYEVTIYIPHATLHTTSFDPSKTEIGDAKNGWLAFGDIKLTMEQQKEFETSAVEKLKARLGEDDCLAEADRFAKLVAYETYQPVVSSVSPMYKVVVEFQA